MAPIVNDAEIFYVPGYLIKYEANKIENEVNDTNKFRRQNLYFYDRNKIITRESAKLSYWYGEFPQETQNNSRKNLPLILH